MDVFLEYLWIFCLGLFFGGMSIYVYLMRRMSTLREEKNFFEYQLQDLKKNQSLEEVSSEYLEKKFSASFENLANRILEEKGKKLVDFSGAAIKGMLDPFKEQFYHFNRLIHESKNQNTEYYTKFFENLEHLKQISQSVGGDADRLVRALKGDNKLQGDWGEVLTERLLEASGLIEGKDYIKQGIGLGLKGEDGGHLKPDFIIYLPGKKHLIIDSKVSLVSYERLSNAVGDKETRQYEIALVQSVKVHIDSLASKHYSDTKGLNTPEVTFLFIPIEPCYIVLSRIQPEIFTRAWDKKIVIVTHSTLMATLYVIANIWRQEKQSQNVEEIARRGGQLYDKFVGFVDTLKSVGKHISRANDEYENALLQLKDGRNNLVRQAEMLKKLGAKTTKQLDSEISENIK